MLRNAAQAALGRVVGQANAAIVEESVNTAQRFNM